MDKQVSQEITQADESNLPSEAQTEEPKGFVVPEDKLEEGKYLGKWSSADEMAEHIKNIEDKYANLKRDVVNKGKEVDTSIQQTAEELAKESQQKQVVESLVPEFLDNGMQLTDEMLSTLKEVGLNELEVKVKAYEIKEAIDKNASYVGGKEEYDKIMAYHAETMSDDDKRAFNYSINNPANSKALMLGLKLMYEQGQSGEVQQTDRVRGTATPTPAIKPYGSKQELLRDKAFIDSPRATQADKQRFRERFKITPDKVWI